MKQVYNKPASTFDIKEIILMHHYDLTKHEAQLYMQIENYLKIQAEKIIETQKQESSLVWNIPIIKSFISKINIGLGQGD